MAEVIVWFDGGCPLCRREIALMRRLDRAGAIQFLDVASPADGACPLDRAELLARFHATEDGRLVSGAAAFAAMWRAIPALRPLGLLARNPLALRVLEAAYRAFLRVRPSLQRVVARLEMRTRGGPPKVVEGPRDSAETAAGALAEVRITSKPKAARRDRDRGRRRWCPPW